MNVDEALLSRVRRVDDSEARAPKFGLDRPYDEDYILNTSAPLRFMATTPGGIEELSAKEIAEKFPTSEIRLRNGKLHFSGELTELKKLHSLRSVDNLYCTVADIMFDWDSLSEGPAAHTPALRQVAEKVMWNDVAHVWSQNQPLTRLLKERRGAKESHEHGRGRSFQSMTFGIFDEADQSCGDVESIRFRCSGKRIGKKQKINSDQAASVFGAAVNDMAGWGFDLKDFNLHLHCHMMGQALQVHLQLTNDSLHRRNITHHGITTLRPTICHGLIREASLSIGDVVLDPMAGCGSIPIEGAISCSDQVYFLASDLFVPAVRRTFQNLDYLNKIKEGQKKGRLMMDNAQFDCTNLPLRDGAIDVIVTDLPFGKRINEGMLGIDKRTLYKMALRELGRVVKKRAVVQSQDSRSVIHALNQLKDTWKPARAPRVVNCGGIRVGIWRLERI